MSFSSKLKGCLNGLARFLLLLCLSSSIWLLLLQLQLGVFGNILFFQGVFCSVTVNLMLAFLYQIGKLLKTLRSHPVPVSLLTSICCLQICFLVVFPVSFDRSVSVFLLAKLATSQQSLAISELQQALIDGYVVGDRAVERRMREQIDSGNVTRTINGGYMLTPQGKRLLCFGESLQSYFHFRNKDLESLCE